MKKLLIILTLFAMPAHAATLCRKNVSCNDLLNSATGWRNNNELNGFESYNSNSEYTNDFPWTTFISESAYPSGTMSGIARCTEEGASASNPEASSTGEYCWCKLTNISSMSASCYSKSGSWTLIYNWSNCLGDCAAHCALCARTGGATPTNCSRLRMIASFFAV